MDWTGQCIVLVPVIFCVFGPATDPRTSKVVPSKSRSYVIVCFQLDPWTRKSSAMKGVVEQNRGWAKTAIS